MPMNAQCPQRGVPPCLHVRADLRLHLHEQEACWLTAAATCGRLMCSRQVSFSHQCLDRHHQLSIHARGLDVHVSDGSLSRVHVLHVQVRQQVQALDAEVHAANTELQEKVAALQSKAAAVARLNDDLKVNMLARRQCDGSGWLRANDESAHLMAGIYHYAMTMIAWQFLSERLQYRAGNAGRGGVHQWQPAEGGQTDLRRKSSDTSQCSDDAGGCVASALTSPADAGPAI